MFYEDYERQLKQLEEERKKELLELIENTKEEMIFAPTREDLREYLNY